MPSEDISPISSADKVRNLPQRDPLSHKVFEKEEKKKSSSTHKKILLVFATYLEAQAFEESEHIFITGMGPEKVRERLTAAVLSQYDEIWNVGFAGAINRTLPFGTIYTISLAGRHALEEQHLPLHPEGKRLITFDEPLHDTKVRDILAEKWDLVDMEGHVIADIARANGVPCHLIKIVSDNADANTTASIIENAPKLSALLRDYLTRLLRS